MAEPFLQAAMAACLDSHAHAHRFSPRQWQVCHHILECRTQALGGLQLACEACGSRLPCCDRHCPRCAFRPLPHGGPYRRE